MSVVEAFVEQLVGKDMGGLRELWDNLWQHKGEVSDNPWLVLGDFNATLSVSENLGSLNSMSLGIIEFRDCVEELEIEYISPAGIMFTWNGKPHRDNGVLKRLGCVMIAHKAEIKDTVKKVWETDVSGVPMFSLVSKLKFLKPSTRILNRKQDNLSKRVKILRHEVELIQGALDWD
ncbi:hypothetical protein Pint_17231 [Pistacia integerrima]|uniref:Uncharacterized protein n=1 Tax=Pistacia integerrima TaxID=434235 RepID=A0ACC0YXL8_9ROSI|nr:hypothetical protein Pint_17231 [Pistacia integerrima]